MKNKEFINYAITFEKEVVDMSMEAIENGLASNVRLMPDTHIGKGCAIGFTSKLTDKVVPNFIGVDIGCGMTVAEFNDIQQHINAIANSFRWLEIE